MNLDLGKDAQDFLATLAAKQFRQVVRKVFALASDPLPPDSSLLKGYDNLRRADIGEFRIIYTIVNDLVKIVLIDRRNDDAVYRA